METWGRYQQFSRAGVVAAFLSKTKSGANECLEWIGALGSHGRYGSVGAMGRHWLAHRLAYTLFVGPIPDGMNVCHRCDNGLCVNVSHLWLGTQRDNVLDMEGKKRGRHLAGEHHGRAKLTARNVIAIRKAHANGKSIRGLARQYGVNKASIARIVHNEGWLTTPLP